MSPQRSEPSVDNWFRVCEKIPTDNSGIPIKSRQDLETGNGKILFLMKPLLVEMMLVEETWTKLHCYNTINPF